jgi:single-strand DNA-binding protein
MVNEANFSVSGYVATQPTLRFSSAGEPSVSMRIGWTPRRMSKVTGEWEDLPSSFVSVVCFRKVAENAAKCLRKGEPVNLSGTLQVREYTDARGEKRLSVDVVARTLGHVPRGQPLHEGPGDRRADR